MQIQRKHIAVIIVLVVGVGLAYDSLSNYVNPYISVSELVLKSNQYQSKNLQVMGKILTNSLERTDNGSIGFTLTDGNTNIGVYYKGITPQNLDQSDDVVVVGSLTKAGTIEATQIMVKCPSKYEGQDSQGVSHVFLASILVAVLGLGYLIFTMVWKRN